MKEKLRRLPDSELAVMQALWSADAPLTRPELDAALTHREWAATTVVALLARLEGKGFIAREKPVSYTHLDVYKRQQPRSPA